jgi:hypothetical protein
VPFAKTILGIGTGKYEPVEIRVENDFPSGKRDWGNGKVAEVNAHAQVGDVGEDGKTEIWPLLMEKAYAKLQSGGLDLKGYQAISNNGVSGDALSAFTGQKSEYHDKPQDIKLDDLAKMHQSGQSILLGTPQSTENGKYGAPSDKKLVYNHSYYVTNVDAAKGTVTIRNPHGWEKGEITIPYNELNKYFWSITANKSGK